jgi:hypothetical protein
MKYEQEEVRDKQKLVKKHYTLLRSRGFWKYLLRMATANKSPN